MKTRSFIVALAAAVVLFASPAAGSAASSVMLRTNVVVDDDVIRLGDLFTNSGKYADTAIARSPIPGRRSVFDAEWLFRVARAFRLAWRPLSLDDRAVVDPGQPSDQPRGDREPRADRPSRAGPGSQHRIRNEQSVVPRLYPGR